MGIHPVLASIGLVAALTAGGAMAGEPALVERTERVDFNIGCNCTGDAPTCDVIQYWLGTDVGNSKAWHTRDVTPMGYAFYRLGAYSPIVFAANSTLAESCVLRGGSKIRSRIKLRGFYSGAEVGVDSGVYVTLGGTRTDTKRIVANFRQHVPLHDRGPAGPAPTRSPSWSRPLFFPADLTAPAGRQLRCRAGRSCNRLLRRRRGRAGLEAEGRDRLGPGSAHSPMRRRSSVTGTTMSLTPGYAVMGAWAVWALRLTVRFSTHASSGSNSEP